MKKIYDINKSCDKTDFMRDYAHDNWRFLIGGYRDGVLLERKQSNSCN